MKIKKYISSKLAQFKQWILSIDSNLFCRHEYKLWDTQAKYKKCAKCHKEFLVK